MGSDNYKWNRGKECLMITEISMGNWAKMFLITSLGRRLDQVV
jgi:hypothetical protein